MKKYTQEEFDSFELDGYGAKQCPSGNYVNVNTKGERCSFGKGCSFGERCSFGKGCSFGEGCKYMAFIFTTVFCLYGVFDYSLIVYLNKESGKYIISAGCMNFESLTEAVKETKKQNYYCERTHKIMKILLDEPNEGE